MANRRQAGRFPVRVTVLVQQIRGTTRDLSAAGVYFVTPEIDCHIGDILSFVLIFDPSGEEQPWHINCRGQIIRREPQSIGMGVALRLLEGGKS